MGFNLSNSTPAAPSGSVNVSWQKDVSGNISANVQNQGGVAVKTANYTAAASDAGQLIQFNSTAAATYTLLATPASTVWNVIVYNRNTGAVTVTPNGQTIDGQSGNVTLLEGDAVAIFTDGTNYFTGSPRPISLTVYNPGLATGGQVMLYMKVDRPMQFPASAPNAEAVAKVTAAASSTFTYLKNGTAFATAVFTASATVGNWSQGAAATFVVGDILELDAPASADATLSNIGLTLQGFRF